MSYGIVLGKILKIGDIFCFILKSVLIVWNTLQSTYFGINTQNTLLRTPVFVPRKKLHKFFGRVNFGIDDVIPFFCSRF